MTAVAAANAAQAPPRPRVLFVDDEPLVLEALTQTLPRTFDIVTATSGAAGLEYLQAEADFAVVVSDMRMPRMDGATFLAHARETAPSTVRILLSGHADVDAAIKAVNHGQVFRFLTKPCPRDTLRHALDSAVAQHKLITGERVLLEQTLRGSIKMLVDILAITNPVAFGRAHQIRTRVLQLASLLGILDSWQLEIAALASQLGYIVLPDELCQKLEAHQALTAEEQEIVAGAPAMTERLLANIPRLEGVRAMLALHINPPRRNPSADSQTQLIELGAHLLRISIDIESVEGAGSDRSSAGRQLLAHTDHYDPEVLDAVTRLYRERPQRFVVRSVARADLKVGMVLAEDARLSSGTLLVARGYEVTASFIQRINNFPRGVFAGEFRIAVPC